MTTWICYLLSPSLSFKTYGSLLAETILYNFLPSIFLFATNNFSSMLFLSLLMTRNCSRYLRHNLPHIFKRSSYVVSSGLKSTNEWLRFWHLRHTLVNFLCDKFISENATKHFSTKVAKCIQNIQCKIHFSIITYTFFPALPSKYRVCRNRLTWTQRFGKTIIWTMTNFLDLQGKDVMG